MKHYLSGRLMMAYCAVIYALRTQPLHSLDETINPVCRGRECDLQESPYLKSALGGTTKDESNKDLLQSNLEIKEHIEAIIRNLKAFACVEDINFLTFTKFSTSAADQISEVGLLMQNSDFSEEVSSMFKFVNEMNQAINEFRNHFDVFNSSTIEEVLLWKLTDIKVSTFCLRKSDGTSDKGKIGFKEAINELRKHFKFCVQLFEDLSMASFQVHAIFIHSCMEIRELLAPLAKAANDS